MKNPEHSPVHILNCGRELLLFYAAEKLYQLNNMMDDAMDVHFGEDE